VFRSVTRRRDHRTSRKRFLPALSATGEPRPTRRGRPHTERAKHVVFGWQGFSDGGSTPPASKSLEAGDDALEHAALDRLFNGDGDLSIFEGARSGHHQIVVSEASRTPHQL
jgi:hypothetical protein